MGEEGAHLVEGMRSAACLWPKSTSYPIMCAYSSFQMHFFLSYAAQQSQ